MNMETLLEAYNDEVRERIKAEIISNIGGSSTGFL